MGVGISFYGPVEVYAHREDGEWVAWGDPFGEVGTGTTFEASLADLQENLQDYLRYVAEELQRHRGKIQFAVRLKDDLKSQCAKRAHFMLYAAYELSPAQQAPAQRRPLKVERLLDALRERRDVRVTPPVACAP